MVIRGALAGIAGLAMSGCLEFPARSDCETGDDCRDDRVCVEGECVAPLVACGFAFPPGDTCATCLEAECCDEAEACQDDPRCAALMDCFARCSFRPDDPSCLGACAGDSEGSAQAEAMLGCLSDACPRGCGECGVGTYVLAPTCVECIERTGPACDAMSACLRDPGCWDIFACSFGCLDPACSTRCGVEDPAAAIGLADATLLANNACGSVCDVGAEWSCIGRYSWGLATPGTTATAHLSVVAAVPEVGVNAVKARACGLLSDQCGEWVESDTSRLALDIELLQPGGFIGYFEVQGETTSGPLIPSLAHVGHPLIDLAAVVVPGAPLASGAQLQRLLGIEIDAARSQLVVTSVDCLTTLGRDVSFEIAADAAGPFYTRSGWPQPEATVTDARGLGMFFNIETPDDGALVTVRANIDGAPLGETQVRLRPGYTTSTTVWPASTANSP